MRVVIKEPSGRPHVAEIDNTLEALQAAVGGYIESVALFTDLAVICNEEGRLKGMPFNCEVCGIGFVGPIVFVGVAGDAFADLSDTGVELITKRMVL